MACGQYNADILDVRKLPAGSVGLALPSSCCDSASHGMGRDYAISHVANWTANDTTVDIILLCFQLTPKFFNSLEMLLLQLAGVFHGFEECAYVVFVGHEGSHLLVYFQ